MSKVGCYVEKREHVDVLSEAAAPQTNWKDYNRAGSLKTEQHWTGPAVAQGSSEAQSGSGTG